jgi:serine/threonine protein kinase/formylglycine-generating enzyme required for sulfatase activity
VVRREDFEREKTFEREFEGIQHYEKVSQDHSGLVDVLHAGRNAAEGYYYYVMELADDVESGAEIDVDRYEPRTLASDLKRHRLRPVRECVSVGALLADALGHLHAAGLTHRDVKPSNVIFVKGVAKLADVGLVTQTGQRTFVGTEGYVPPEGPGTALADLYSLAMVLYEMGTGKDRLDFPELPTNLELPPTINRDEWRALNAVICRAGAPDPRRRFENGQALAAALKRIVGESPTSGSIRRRFWLATAAAAVVVLALGAGAYAYLNGENPPKPEPPVSQPLVPPIAGLDTPAKGENGPSNAIDPASSGPAAPMNQNPGGNGLPDAFTIGTATQNDPFAIGGGKGTGIVISDPKPPADPTKPIPPTAIPIPKSWLKITQPNGAEVWRGNELLAVIPTDFLEFDPGPVQLTLKSPGHHDFTLQRDLPPNRREIESDITLIPDRGPVEGQEWRDSLDLVFRPLGKRHITENPISREVFERFLEESRYPFTLVIPQSARTPEMDGLALADDAAMWAFCDWLTEKDRAGGFLSAGRFHHPQQDNNDPEAKIRPFFSRIESSHGSLAVNSEPAGAAVYLGNVRLGDTPLTLERHRVGLVRLVLKLPGYRDTPVNAMVSASDVTPALATLTRDDSVLFTEIWRNGLGMTFVPVSDFMASMFETRVADYAAFIAAKPAGIEAPNPDFDQGPDHPVAGVNLLEARAFCAWLTEKERAEGLIEEYHSYRVPTDLQWSAMAGLTDENGPTPEIRDVRKAPGQYPWGTEWPPPPRSGNFGDAKAKEAKTVRGGVVPSYDDGFAFTAPVGSFLANPYEIHDLAGNVWEWVDEPFNEAGNRLYTVRGGGWASFQQSNLLTGFRNAIGAEYKRGGGGEYGFRCVLVDTRKSPLPPAATRAE